MRDHLWMRALVLVCVASGAASSLAQGTDGGSPSTTPDGVRLEITPWQREVVPFEPILIKVEVSNPTDRTVAVAPPYLRYFDMGILTVEVRDEHGDRLPHPQPGRGPYETGDYGHDLMSDSYRLAPPMPPLRLEPGQSQFAWFDVLSYYPIDPPGRYHLLFHYRSGPDLVTDPSDPAKPGDAETVADLVIDAGWVTVKEPAGDDVRAVELMRAMRDEYHASGICFGWATKQLRAEAPGCRVLSWGDTVGVAWSAPFNHRLYRIDRYAARLRAEHPDSPLTFRLDLIELYRAWEVPACGLLSAYSTLAGRGPECDGYARMAADWSQQRARLVAYLPGLRAEADAARPALREAARATGDYALIWAIEASIWVLEEWQRWPTGPDGFPVPPPETDHAPAGIR